LFGLVVVATVAGSCQYLIGSRVSDLLELPLRPDGCGLLRRSKQQAEVRAKDCFDEARSEDGV
jgi:hypothetical protein